MLNTSILHLFPLNILNPPFDLKLHIRTKAVDFASKIQIDVRAIDCKPWLPDSHVWHKHIHIHIQIENRRTSIDEETLNQYVAEMNIGLIKIKYMSKKILQLIRDQQTQRKPPRAFLTRVSLDFYTFQEFLDFHLG